MNFIKGSLPLLVALIVINGNFQISDEFKLKYDLQKPYKNEVPIIDPAIFIKQVKCHVVHPGSSKARKNPMILDFMPSDTKKDLSLLFSKCIFQKALLTKMSGDIGIHIHDYMVLQGDIEDKESAMECWITVCTKDKQDLYHNINNTLASPDDSLPRHRVARDTRDIMTENEIEPFDQNEETAYNLKASRFLPSYYPMQSFSGFTDKKGLNPLSLYLIRGKKGLYYVMPPMKTSKEKGIADGDLSDKRAPPQGFWGSRGK